MMKILIFHFILTSPNSLIILTAYLSKDVNSRLLDKLIGVTYWTDGLWNIFSSICPVDI